MATPTALVVTQPDRAVQCVAENLVFKRNLQDVTRGLEKKTGQDVKYFIEVLKAMEVDVPFRDSNSQPPPYLDMAVVAAFGACMKRVSVTTGR